MQYYTTKKIAIMAIIVSIILTVTFLLITIQNYFSFGVYYIEMGYVNSTWDAFVLCTYLNKAYAFRVLFIPLSYIITICCNVFFLYKWNKLKRIKNYSKSNYQKVID